MAQPSYSFDDLCTGGGLQDDVPFRLSQNAPAVRYWPVSPGGVRERAAGYPFDQFVSITDCNPGSSDPSCYWPGCP